MPDQVELNTTPFRLGVLFVNTVAGTVEKLREQQYEMAAEAREGMEEILAMVPIMDAEQLLSFVAGATLRVDEVLDALDDGAAAGTEAMS